VCHAGLHKKLVRVFLGFRLGLGVRDSVGGDVVVVGVKLSIVYGSDLQSMYLTSTVMGNHYLRDVHHRFITHWTGSLTCIPPSIHVRVRATTETQRIRMSTKFVCPSAHVIILVYSPALCGELRGKRKGKRKDDRKQNMI
jgi:hypothetical protein